MSIRKEKKKMRKWVRYFMNRYEDLCRVTPYKEILIKHNEWIRSDHRLHNNISNTNRNYLKEPVEYVIST